MYSRSQKHKLKKAPKLMEITIIEQVKGNQNLLNNIVSRKAYSLLKVIRI